MARKQTRRTVSLNRSVYDRLAKEAKRRNKPLSVLVQDALEAMWQIDASAESVFRPSSTKDPGGYIVNVDLMLHAESPRNAEDCVTEIVKRLVAKEKKLQEYLVLGTDKQ